MSIAYVVEDPTSAWLWIGCVCLRKSRIGGMAFTNTVSYGFTNMVTNTVLRIRLRIWSVTVTRKQSAGRNAGRARNWHMHSRIPVQT